MVVHGGKNIQARKSQLADLRMMFNQFGRDVRDGPGPDWTFVSLHVNRLRGLHWYSTS